MSGEELRDEWFRYARDDQQMAELALREDGPPNPICFHTQQMAEKYLKGFLPWLAATICVTIPSQTPSP